MAPYTDAVVGYTVNPTIATNLRTWTVPTGVVAGDLLVAWTAIRQDGATPTTAPTGWNFLTDRFGVSSHSQGSQQYTIRLWGIYRVAQGAEGGQTVTMNSSISTSGADICIALRRADLIAVTSGVSVSDGTTATTAAAGGSGSNHALRLYAAGEQSNLALITPASPQVAVVPQQSNSPQLAAQATTLDDQPGSALTAALSISGGWATMTLGLDVNLPPTAPTLSPASGTEMRAPVTGWTHNDPDSDPQARWALVRKRVVV